MFVSSSWWFFSFPDSETEVAGDSDPSQRCLLPHSMDPTAIRCQLRFFLGRKVQGRRDRVYNSASTHSAQDAGI